MVSRIHQLKPYETVDFSAYRKIFQVDEAALSSQCQRLQNRFLRWEEGTVADLGDATLCTLTSQVPKFQKKAIPISVGAGLLPSAIEQALVGMQVGQEKTVQVDGQSVGIKLLSVKNRYLPELTDALVARLDLDGITTVAQLRQSLIQQQKQECASADSYEAAQYVMEATRQQSEFILSQQDWQKLVDMDMQRNYELARQDGLDLKTMTARDFQGRIPATCYDGVVSLTKTRAFVTLQNYLLGVHYAALDGYTVDEESYEQFIRNYQKTWRVTEEMARRSNTYEYYCINTLAAYFVQKVSTYVQEHIYLEE